MTGRLAPTVVSYSTGDAARAMSMRPCLTGQVAASGALVGADDVDPAREGGLVDGGGVLGGAVDEDRDGQPAQAIEEGGDVRRDM